MECILEDVITGAGGFSGTNFCKLLVCGRDTCGGLSNTGSNTDGRMVGTEGVSFGAAMVDVTGATDAGGGADVKGGIIGGCCGICIGWLNFSVGGTELTVVFITVGIAVSAAST